MHGLTHAAPEALMSEVNNQLKKLSHEAKKGDVAAETIGQNLTRPQLFTPPLRFQFSLCTYSPTHAHTCIHNTHTNTKHTHKHKSTHIMWFHLVPESLPTKTYMIPIQESVFPSSPFLVHQHLLSEEDFRGSEATNRLPNVPSPGKFTQQFTSLIRFPLLHSLLWFQTDPNDVKPG